MLIVLRRGVATAPMDGDFCPQTGFIWASFHSKKTRVKGTGFPPKTYRFKFWSCKLGVPAGVVFGIGNAPKDRDR